MSEVAGYPAQPGRSGYVVLHIPTGTTDPESGRPEREYDRYHLVRACPWCGKENRVVVPAPGLWAWEHGEHAQTAFPQLTADEREAVMSGTHPACWDEMYPDEEEETVENDEDFGGPQ